MSAARGEKKDKPELKAEFQGKTGDTVRFALIAADSKGERGGEGAAPDERTEAENQRRSASPAGAKANDHRIGYASYDAKDGLVERLSMQMPREAGDGIGSTSSQQQPNRADAEPTDRLEIRRVEG